MEAFWSSVEAPSLQQWNIALTASLTALREARPVSSPEPKIIGVSRYRRTGPSWVVHEFLDWRESHPPLDPASTYLQFIKDGLASEHHLSYPVDNWLMLLAAAPTPENRQWAAETAARGIEQNSQYVWAERQPLLSLVWAGDVSDPRELRRTLEATVAQSDSVLSRGHLDFVQLGDGLASAFWSTSTAASAHSWTRPASERRHRRQVQRRVVDLRRYPGMRDSLAAGVAESFTLAITEMTPEHLALAQRDALALAKHEASWYPTQASVGALLLEPFWGPVTREGLREAVRLAANRVSENFWTERDEWDYEPSITFERLPKVIAPERSSRPTTGSHVSMGAQAVQGRSEKVRGL